MSNSKAEVKTEEVKISTDKKSHDLDWTSLKKLFAYLFDHKWQMILVFVCVIVSSVTQVLGISMMQPIIDNHILKSDMGG
ncbi:MAG: ABC transporter ATP-binding protein, partial [Anaerococcus sp.]|nr:ABC transporter ATP-binding protein [Anaerococcus sp.]